MSKILFGTSLIGERSMPHSSIEIGLIHLPKLGRTQAPWSLYFPSPLDLGPPTGFYCLNGAGPSEGLRLLGPCIRDTPSHLLMEQVLLLIRPKPWIRGADLPPPPVPSALR